MTPGEQIIEIFQRGGPVMWPLLLLSVLSLAITLERSAYWLRLHAPGRRARTDRLATLLAGRDRGGVEAATARDSTLYADAARELAAYPPSPESAGAASVELVERYRPGFERFHAVQATVIAASPLLGILGTVLGIIDAFDLLGQSQVEDIAAVAGGIAQALITTAFGLVVALLTLFPAMVFRAQADHCLGSLERMTAAASRATPTAHNKDERVDDRPAAKRSEKAAQ